MVSFEGLKNWDDGGVTMFLLRLLISCANTESEGQLTGASGIKAQEGIRQWGGDYINCEHDLGYWND